MIPEFITSILDGDKIAPQQVEDVLHEIMQGAADELQVAGFLVALASRPLEAPVLAAAARAMRAHRNAIHPEVRPLVDTCGTGGDGAGSFNISTTTALVLAAAGAAVAKHGNRGVSSKVGSADVLEASGCALGLTPDDCCELLDATGFAFLFAPAFHPAMRHVAPVRKRLKVRSIFNVLGPLANPALAEYQLLGVYDPQLTSVVAHALLDLGSKGAIVVHCAGLDEIGLHAITTGHRVRDGEISEFRLDPAELGLDKAPISDLAGGEIDENVGHMRDALTGKPGPRTDIVALNVAAALEVAERVSSLAEGLTQARDLLTSGAGLRVLERYAESSTRKLAEREGGA